MFPHLPLGIYFLDIGTELYLSLYVKTGYVISYVDNFSKTLNN
jgi:hypothetical protein